jgi:hypothetical protein
MMSKIGGVSREESFDTTSKDRIKEMAAGEPSISDSEKLLHPAIL